MDAMNAQCLEWGAYMMNASKILDLFEEGEGTFKCTWNGGFMYQS
jgi:hypothetical protein